MKLEKDKAIEFAMKLTEVALLNGKIPVTPMSPEETAKGVATYFMTILDAIVEPEPE